MTTKLTSALLALLVVAAVPTGVGAAGTAQAECSFPVTATDATGTEATVEERPKRVTTLSPSAAQTMWEIGAESQVVGLSEHATYLEGAESRTNVSAAGQSRISVETVVSTEPDLVLAPNVISNDTVEQLRDAGLTVYKFEFAASIDDIYAKTELAGELTGNCEAAGETVSSMRDRISTVEQAVENSERPRVFVSVGGGWTAGQGTFVNSMVELAGGTNVAVEANITSYQQISEEVIVEQDPEWIVQLGEFGAYPKTDAYNGTSAVQNDRVMTIDDPNISQPAPRVANGIVRMAEAFHPEAYAEANATTTTATETTAETELTTAAPTTDESAMAEATTESSGTSGGVPGFGVPAALAALAGAALVAGRR
jgi:iron complex transport system substrate-binding protein